MTDEEKQRMIHIRIKSDIHKELRKAAAESDQTMQELVAEAVEQRVEEREIQFHIEEIQLKIEERAREIEERALETAEKAMEIELRSRELEDREIELELTVELDEGTPSSRETVIGRVQRMEKLLTSLAGQLAILKTELIDNE